MTLQQIRYFIAVAQNLSFSKAAQQHYVSQTAVSQQIKLLEEELETELFQRTRHSVALTSAGQVFYEYAVRITDLAEDAARRTRAAAAECSTPLEIGMMSGMENLPILEKLLLFKEQHPAIPLHFHLGDFPTLKKRLQQKKLDFALQLELVPLEDASSLLRAQVGQLRQYVVLNRQSHLSSYASLHRSQLASEQYYVPAMDRELWNQFAQVLTRHGSDPQNIKFAYSMEKLMLQLAFYGGYTILAEPVLAQLPAMKELYGHRARLRKERGCMDIESGEVKLILDEDGHCIDVKKRTSGESEAMIEEFMLLANQCAAHFARVKQIPFVYRVHEEPNAEKLERLHTLLQACGINDHFAKDVPTPKELSAILEGVRGGPYEQIINTGMLRCMSKAVYEEKPKGHYGLVLKDYAHFTSPIRRYPDLAIHRMMTDLLSGTDKETMIVRYTDFAEKASKQSSEREVLAVQIERKAEDYYKAEYARRHLGECYEGIISGVTQRGIFVELENGVEGFVPASSLTATGTTLTEGIRLSDPASGKTWSLGDSMMITIVRADINLGKVDFEVAPETK